MTQKKHKAAQHFSKVSPTLLTQRVPASEALLEEWIRRTPDDGLRDVVYFFHDWAISNKERGFYHLGKYFDQDKDEIDAAIEIFKKQRKNVLPPQDGETVYSQLQLFLLYDCLIHIGSLKRNDRTVSYLDDNPQLPPLTDLSALKHGSIYNYVVVDGELRICAKGWHHSEAAMGKAVTAAGEIALFNGEILINCKSGHYRPLPETVEAVAERVSAVRKEEIMLCEDFLFRYMEQKKDNAPKVA